ncbi:hypothetical protein KO02_23060 [Sphingobacterium sp. ML3W]|uniref:hypothetical protein n=1 Tax=Sphingobacterium sp. ML3W TaxID=1538644 RepID=UPI0004F62FA0|nr:hypothetical protein [Sphingobacterium sp. ML3W]AIM39244.1 hypothetical protein KO02_23060 [Sphingobacterium sp. ML3W]
MKKILKNLNIGALIALISVVTMTVSWKNHEGKKATPTWYQVSLISPTGGNIATNQKIDGLYPGGAPSGSCNNLAGATCAVQLSDVLEPIDMPATVKEANDDGFTSQAFRQHQ